MRACIGLGSNLGDPPAQLQRAVEALAALPGTRVLAASPLYRNPPLGPQDQPDYANAAVLLETTLEPLALLDALQAIEQAQGRVRAERWGPRTLDLDLLLYGDRVLDTPRLTLPHPGVAARRFVLQPLLDLDPCLALPDGRRVAALLAGLPDSPLEPAGRLRLPDSPI